MPWSRPTPQQIRDRIAPELEALSPGADARYRRSYEAAIVKAVALASTDLHDHLDWIAAQLRPKTAAPENLARDLDMWGVPPAPAQIAIGYVQMRGVAGKIVPGETEMRRGDDRRYRTSADTVIGLDGTALVPVYALTAGASSNTAAGASLTLIAPVEGIQSQAVAGVDGLTGGSDIETPARVIQRLYARIQEPPHGGADFDYAGWVKEITGDTRVWVYPRLSGAGTVGVSFIMPDGTMPAPTDVARVQSHVDSAAPVTADVIVFAPVADLVAFSIKVTPDTDAVRQAVMDELDAYLLDEAEPGGTLPRSRLDAAISSSTGEYQHIISVPAGDVVSAPGHIARRGVITWVP